MKNIVKFFDKLEDKTRAHLSQYPLIYSLIGGVGVVLFWRGIWHTADQFAFLTGPVSILISLAILLLTGLFVSFFVGDRIIISGLKKDKKIIEKAKEELKDDRIILAEVKEEIRDEKIAIAEVKEELKKVEDALEKMAGKNNKSSIQ